MKKLFWKTYRVRFVNVKRDLLNIQFFRGFTWEVVEMAGKEAEKLTEKNKQSFIVEEITRIY